MKHNLYKLVLVTLVAVVLLPVVAYATDVDYDAIDEAALPMVAQTSLPQAADQFCRAYRQLLVYDHEEYRNEYDYDNLEGSLIAGSIVVSYDIPDGTFAVWMAVLSSFASDALGYEDGSVKMQTLSSTQSFLGSAWQRIKLAASAFCDGVYECMTSKPAIVAGAVIACVALAVAIVAYPVGGAIALYGLGGLATICIGYGLGAFADALFFGIVFVPVRRKKRKQYLPVCGL